MQKSQQVTIDDGLCFQRLLITIYSVHGNYIDPLKINKMNTYRKKPALSRVIRSRVRLLLPHVQPALVKRRNQDFSLRATKCIVTCASAHRVSSYFVHSFTWLLLPLYYCKLYSWYNLRFQKRCFYRILEKKSQNNFWNYDKMRLCKHDCLSNTLYYDFDCKHISFNCICDTIFKFILIF